MIELRKEDSYHKAQLLRLLMEITDNKILSQLLYFKGGSCAALLGYLDRFSVDLDFDLKDEKQQKLIRNEFYSVFEKVDFVTDQDNPAFFQFLVKYKARPGERNSLKLSALYHPFKNNKYAGVYIKEIDRLVNCQTIETMFSHKLVAVIDRFKKQKTIAGRDIYDIHHFFLQGYSYNRDLIEERTAMTMKNFLGKLIGFVKQHVTLTIINQDLNTLLPFDKFQKIRKVLINETLMFLSNELAEIKSH